MRWIVATTLLLTACVAMKYPSVFQVIYTSEDSPEDKKFYVKYRNETKSEICLYPTNWPDGEGKIDTAKDRVFLSVSGENYSIEDFNTGYCPECTIRVKSGEEIAGFFKYTDFHIPLEDYRKKKDLIFSPMATHCP